MKYKASGRADNFNNGKWLYIGKRTLEQIVAKANDLVYTEYKLVDENGVETIVSKENL